MYKKTIYILLISVMIFLTTNYCGHDHKTIKKIENEKEKSDRNYHKKLYIYDINVNTFKVKSIWIKTSGKVYSSSKVIASYYIFNSNEKEGYSFCSVDVIKEGVNELKESFYVLKDSRNEIIQSGYFKIMNSMLSIKSALESYKSDQHDKEKKFPKGNTLKEMRQNGLTSFYIKDYNRSVFNAFSSGVQYPFGGKYYIKINKDDTFLIGSGGSDKKFNGWNQKGVYTTKNIDGQDVILTDKKEFILGLNEFIKRMKKQK